METGHLIIINYESYKIVRVEEKKRFDPVSYESLHVSHILKSALK